MQVAFPKSTGTNYILRELYVDWLRNLEVGKAFLTKEPKTLDEAMTVAQLWEVISYAVLDSPLDMMALGPTSKKIPGREHAYWHTWGILQQQ